MGQIKSDQLICKYHGFHYNPAGQCTLIPANPQASIPRKLCLKTYPVKEAFGLVWTTLTGTADDPNTLPIFPEWTDADYQQVLPDAISINAAAGRQMEGFLDVAHFSWVHADSFGDLDNPIVPKYPVTSTSRGLHAEYTSTVSNFPKGFQHLAPDGFQWLRAFDVFLPFTALLRVHFPKEGLLCILNAASPISARKTSLIQSALSQLRQRPAPRAGLQIQLSGV